MSKPTDVADIHVLPTYIAECKANCVEIFEEFLALARDGKMTQCAISFTTSDGYTGERFSMQHDQMRILASITMMQQTMAMRIRMNDRPLIEDDKDPA